MITIDETVSLPQDPDALFAYLADFRNLPSWDPGIARAKLKSGGPPVAEGTKFHVVAWFMGAPAPMTYRVTHYDPDERRAVLEGDSLFVRATDRIHVEAAGDEARLHWTAEFSFKGPSKWAEAATRPLFDRMGRRAIAGLVETKGAGRKSASAVPATARV